MTVNPHHHSPQPPDDGEAREHRDERDLRERFAEERQGEAGGIPTFARVVAGRAARPSAWRVPALALGAAAILAVALTTWRSRVDERRMSEVELPPEFTVIAGSLRVPTDYFLELAAGTTVLRADEIPAIGAIDWYPLIPAASETALPTQRRN